MDIKPTTTIPTPPIKQSRARSHSLEKNSIVSPHKKRRKKVPASLEPSTGYWLIKSEPETRLVKGIDVKYSYDDLVKDTVTHWDGVRNAEANNHMTVMELGDQCLYYHSNCKTPGVVGIASVVKLAYPDHTAFDSDDPHYDPKSNKEKPKWFMVDVEPVRKFDNFIPLSQIKSDPELSEMQLVRRGRLSVQRVKKSEFEYICALGDVQE